MNMSHMPQAYIRYYIDAGAFAVACRVMWATLNWKGRLYVLTDQRILRFAGVFTIDVFECPLRKVARTNLVRAFSERVLRLGSIEIIPSEENPAATAWQMISRPAREQIEAAIHKAKDGGCGGCDIGSLDYPPQRRRGRGEDKNANEVTDNFGQGQSREC